MALTVPSTQGVTVAVHDLGGEGDRPLLVTHANGFHGRTYLPLAAELAQHWRVWALDFRGHGESTAPDDGDFDWSGIVDDLLAVVDALGGGPLDLVGHSMGGAAAVAAEQRRAGTVRAAYLYEPIILPGPVPAAAPGSNVMAEGARRRRATFASKAEALRSYAGRPPLGRLRADALAAYVEHGFGEQADGTVALRCRPEHEAAMFEAGGRITVETARQVDVPVTVAVGATDHEWSPAAFAAPVADALPQGRLSPHPLLGHFGPLEHPAAVAADIAATFT